MSPKRPDENTPTPATDGRGDDMLEQNVASLMKKAHDPPRFDPEARTRILQGLQAEQRHRLQTTEAPAKAASEASETPAWLPLAFAGGLAVALGALVLVLVLGAPRTPFGPRAASLWNAGPAPRAVTLRDGSRLLLRAGALVAVEGSRQVRVARGEVLFDIVPGSKPFIVQTLRGRAVVLGTRFLLGAELSRTWAAVIRGKVRLENAQGKVTLGAGQQGVLAGRKAPALRRAPRLSHLSAWATGQGDKKGKAAAGTPARRGTLLARNPTWQKQEFPLPLRKLRVDVHLENQVARVALDQTFFNPRWQQLEGVYRFPLPSGAAISRLAMYVEGKLEEGGIIERQRGRRIYEDIVYTRRDPALLEWMEGNLFRVRIFPLPGRREKRLLMSYTQELTGLYDDLRLVLPLPAMDQPVGQVAINLRLKDCARCQVHSPSHALTQRVDGADRLVSYHGQRERLGTDLVLRIRRADRKTKVVAHTDPQHSYWLTRLRPKLPAATGAPAPQRRWVLLYDTSASRQPLTLKAQAALADRLLGELDLEDELAVLAFDTTRRRFAKGFQKLRSVNRKALGKWLAAQGSEGVGATNLGRALGAAADLLAAQPAGPEPHILLLSDGLPSAGDRDVDALAARLGGRARLVALAVGSPVNERLLRDLAARSGGLFATANPGEDLRWRAFDVIATLNTPRVVGLKATLADAQGQAVPARAYLSAAQLADGEEVSVALRLVGNDWPRQLRLQGRLGGKPWHQVIELPATQPDPTASYLPRLWAQRRIDHLMAKGKAARRAAKKEITALGMAQFLVTPETSLLVLENEAMYKKYKVTRGGHGWQRLPLPKKIKVVRERWPGVRPQVRRRGKTLERRRQRIFGHNRYGYHFRSLSFETGLRGIDVTGTLGVVDLGITTLSCNGLDNDCDQAGFGGWGDFTKGGGGAGGFRLDGQLAASPRPRDWTVRALGSDQLKLTNLEFKTTLDGRSRFGGLNNEFSIISGQETVYADKFAPVTFALPVLDELAIGEQNRWGAMDIGRGYFSYNPGWRRHAYPRLLTSSYDQNLSDLSEFVPALYPTAMDRLLSPRRQRGAKGAKGAPRVGSVTAEAAQWIATVRRGQLGRRYRDTKGSWQLDVDPQGRFVRTRRLATGLREQVHFDGTHLRHHYSSLGLSSERKRGGEAALRLIPLLLPDAKVLGRWFKVTLCAADRLCLELVGSKGGGRLELSVDSRQRITALRWRVASRSRVLVELRYEGGQVSLIVGKRTRTLALSELANLDAIAAQAVVVAMPLRPAKHWEAALKKAAPKSAAWRHAWVQRLASIAAARQSPQLWKALQERAKTAVPVRRGELTLASRAAPYVTPAVFKLLAQGLERTDVVLRHLRAVRGFHVGQKLAPLRALAKDDGLPGLLASYRLAIRMAEQGPRQTALAEFERFAKRSRLPLLTYLAARRLRDHYLWNRAKDAVRVWDAVGKGGRYGRLAQLEAARALVRGGQRDEAVKRYERLFDTARTAAEIPAVDYRLKQAFTLGSRGKAGWKLFWQGWRKRVLDSGSDGLLVALARTAANTGQAAELVTLSGRLSLLVDRRPGLALPLVRIYLRAQKFAQAATLLRARLRGKVSPRQGLALYATLSQLEARLGHNEPAASAAAKALAAADGVGLKLTTWRRLAQRALTQYAAAALAAQPGPVRQVLVSRGLAVAARWRRVDPDNPAHERQAAKLLHDVGRDEEAWRYLSTRLERHPGEGSAQGKVAEGLETLGRFDRAAEHWQRAAELEPTNPKWLLRDVQNRLARKQTTAHVCPLLRKLREGKWHSRFNNDVNRARKLWQKQRCPTYTPKTP